MQRGPWCPVCILCRRTWAPGWAAIPLGVPAPPGARMGLVGGGEGHGGLKPAGPGGQGLCVCTAGGCPWAGKEKNVTRPEATGTWSAVGPSLVTERGWAASGLALAAPQALPRRPPLRRGRAVAEPWPRLRPGLGAHSRSVSRPSQNLNSPLLASREGGSDGPRALLGPGDRTQASGHTRQKQQLPAVPT